MGYFKSLNGRKSHYGSKVRWHLNSGQSRGDSRARASRREPRGGAYEVGQLLG